MIAALTPATPEFDSEERAAIVAEWRRLAAEPPPFNPRPYGCATLIMAVAVLLLLPAVGLKLPQPWGLILLVVLGLVAAGGFFVGVFVGSGVYGRASTRANAALDWLSGNAASSDAEARRQHAVALLFNAVVSDGPTTSSTIDFAQARERLGAGLPYVVAVERTLCAEVGFAPVFANG